MSYALNQRYERLRNVLERLSRRSAAGATIVVEGPRDVAALRRLGVSGSILCSKYGRRSLRTILDSIPFNQEIVLLTDFDREGHELKSKIKSELEGRGVAVDDKFWRELRGLARYEVRSVQELRGFLERLHVKVSA